MIRRGFTLIEIMIAIFIISMVGGVLVYNLKGSLDEGRSYKSEYGSRQVYEILTLRAADGISINEIVSYPEKYLLQSGLVTNANSLLKDGWGRPYQIMQIGDDGFVVFSMHWYQFLRDRKLMSDEEIMSKYPWAFNFDD